jgi:methyl-accepting chemotaxis protein WspA
MRNHVRDDQEKLHIEGGIMASLIQKLNVKWRLAGFVCFMLLLITGAGLGGLNGMRSSNYSLSIVYNEQILPLAELRAIEGVFLDIITVVDKILLEESPIDKALLNIETQKNILHHKIENLIQGTTGNALADRKDNRIAGIEPLLTQADKSIDKLILMLSEKEKEALGDFTVNSLYPLATEFKTVVNDMVQKSLGAAKNEYEQAQFRYNASKKAFTITLIVALIISLLASYFLVRTINNPLVRLSRAIDHMTRGDLTKRLQVDRKDEFGILIDGFNKMADNMCQLVSEIQQSGMQVTDSITELASTNKEQEAIANEHAATTSEIAASTAEIAATGNNLMATTKKVNSLAKNASFAASQGHSGLNSINHKMITMEDATLSIVNKLSILSEKAGNIAGVVKTINKVADQTNLLSLNAAIEAEKAGEYGAGFSVVANEIRRLADQTAVATFDIEQMVQEVQSAIASTVMGIDKFAVDAHKNAEDIRNIAEELAGVIEQVEVLQPQIDGLTEGIDAQTQGAKQISEAINQLNLAAQQTAESIVQTSSTISQLHQAALGLQEEASRFHVHPEDRTNAAPLI